MVCLDRKFKKYFSLLVSCCWRIGGQHIARSMQSTGMTKACFRLDKRISATCLTSSPARLGVALHFFDNKKLQLTTVVVAVVVVVVVIVVVVVETWRLRP